MAFNKKAKAEKDDVIDSPTEEPVEAPIEENPDVAVPAVEEPAVPEEIAPEESEIAPSIEEPAVEEEISNELIPVAPLYLPPVASAAIVGQAFQDFLSSEIIDFLGIVTIECVHQRRAQLLSHKLGEEGIQVRLGLSESYLNLLVSFGLQSESEELIAHCEELLKNLQLMKQWLGI